MKHTHWLLILVLTSPAMSQTTVPAPEDSDIPRLIKQLGDDDWATREAAQEELVRAGGAALPALRNAVQTTTDEELRQRASTSIRKIEDEQRAGPTRLTLDMVDAPAEQVFTEIARQSSLPLPLDVSEQWRAAAPRLTVKVSREPLWNVLRPLCVKAKVHPEWRLGGMALVEGYQGELDGRACVSGPFLVLLKDGECGSTRVRGRQVGGALTMLNIVVWAEPKIVLANHPNLAMLKRAVDDQDRVVGVPGLLAVPLGQRRVIKTPAHSGTFSVSLTLRTESGAESLQSLVGEIPAVTVALKSQTIVIDKPLTAEPRRERLDGHEVVVGPMALEGRMYVLALNVDHRFHNRQGSHLGSGGWAKAGDARGRLLSFNGWIRNVPDGQDRIQAALGFTPVADVGEPARVICSIHTETLDSQIPFEFKNVLLP